MNKIILIIIMSNLTLISANKKEILNNFVKSLNNNDIIEYNVSMTFTDESKGSFFYNSKLNEKITFSDKSIGFYFNYSSDSNTNVSIYNGKEFFSYYEKSNKDKVEQLTRLKNKSIFEDEEISFNGQKGVRPARHKSSSFYRYSYAYLINYFKKEDNHKEWNLHKDTIVNGVICYHLSNSYNNIFINKSDFRPLLYISDVKVQNTIIKYSNYILVSKKNNLFTKAYFPKNFIFASHLPYKEKFLKSGTIAPNFRYTTIYDKDVELNEYSNSNYFIIITEIGCPPCMQVMPVLNEIASKYKDLKVISMYAIDSKDALLKLSKEKNINYDIVAKSKGIYDDYKVSGYPTFFLIGKDNLIKYSNAGYGPGLKKVFYEEIDKLLESK